MHFRPGICLKSSGHAGEIDKKVCDLCGVKIGFEIQGSFEFMRIFLNALRYSCFPEAWSNSLSQFFI